MSQENVDLIRNTFARFQAGDATWKDFVHPEIEWDFRRTPWPTSRLVVVAVTRCSPT